MLYAGLGNEEASRQTRAPLSSLFSTPLYAFLPPERSVRLRLHFRSCSPSPFLCSPLAFLAVSRNHTAAQMFTKHSILNSIRLIHYKAIGWVESWRRGKASYSYRIDVEVA